MKWNRVVMASAVVLSLGLSACGAKPDVKQERTDSSPSWNRNFYWGTATAGYQVEGDAPDSNWRRYVDRTAGKPVTDPFGAVEPYKQADDFRHRYKEDIANAHAMGVNTFRFGVEWARVMPQPGVWDEKELAYYDDVVATLNRIGHEVEGVENPAEKLAGFRVAKVLTAQADWLAYPHRRRGQETACLSVHGLAAGSRRVASATPR